MYPKSDAQPYLPELLHDTSSLDLSDDSGRNTEGLDDKNMKLEMETFSSNEQSEVETSPNGTACSFNLIIFLKLKKPIK